MWLKVIQTRSSRWYADLLVAAGIIGLFYLIATTRVPEPYASGAQISTSLGVLPYYALRSLLRMFIAYLLALGFTLAYGYQSAYNPRAERVLVPLLDILQSIPVLSFMPSVVLAMVAILPYGNLGPEVASILLIFTAQAWNMTYSFYHSLANIPTDLREAAGIYRLGTWQRLRQLELPFAAVGLVWNSMMSWAGGWFTLMASEMFRLGDQSFRLPGIGSFLQKAASDGNIRAVWWGIGALVVVIVLLDQLMWRPIVAWADKFKLEQVGSTTPPRSTVLTLLRRSRGMEWLNARAFGPFSEWLDRSMDSISRRLGRSRVARPLQKGWGLLLPALAVFLVLWGVWKGGSLLLQVPVGFLPHLGLATLYSLGRVFAALLLGTLWTVPVGVWIGSNPRLSSLLQPVAQILASIPATALFPVILLYLLRLRGGLEVAAIVLMLLGTQWYVLFNVIAGASAIPSDLKEASAIFKVGGWGKWRTLILPAIFPYLITGLVNASGGAWNATIVSEYVNFRERTVTATGLGAIISESSQGANFPVLLAATLTLSICVVVINRLVWRRLYRLAESKYKL